MKKEVAIRIESKRGLTAILPDDLYVELKEFCRKRDLTLRVVIQIALEQFFTRTKAEARAVNVMQDTV